MPEIFNTLPSQTEYDVIIVGGGASGCVVAGRLAGSRSTLSVLLIESGVNNLNHPRIIRPGLYISNLGPELGFCQYYVANENEHCAGKGTRAVIPVGNVLGGSSSVNYMMYTRPAMSDFDDWKTEGWAAEDVKPMLRKTETYEFRHNPNPDLSVHGTSGPVHISAGGDVTQEKSAREFLDSAQKLGYRIVQDLQNGKESNAFSRWAKFICPRTGRRQDAAHAYVHPETSNPNFMVLCEHKVSRVVLSNDGEGGLKATGVEVIPSAALTTPPTIFTARRMVVLSAGSLSTPQILERSGIGSRELLEKLRIGCKVDLPNVGENYQDHNLVTCVFKFDKSLGAQNELYRGAMDLDDHEKAERDFENGKGALTNNYIDYGGKLRPSEQELAEMGGDFQKVWRDYFQNAKDKPVIWAGAIQGLMFPFPELTRDLCYSTFGSYTEYPMARGRIHITSPIIDPASPPEFDPAYLTHPADMAPLVWSYKIVRNLARGMASFRGEVESTHPPFAQGSSAACIGTVDGGVAMAKVVYTEEDNKVLESWVRRNVATTWHAMGTCAMKPRQEGGVVDGRLGVYGVKGLKIADLSICPSNVSANTYGTALMIGEMAAKFLKEELGIVE